MFVLSEFLIESIIREGLVDIQQDIDMKLNDIFGYFAVPSLSSKYGNNEMMVIKNYLLNHWQKIRICQSINQLQENNVFPAFSIHLMGDSEDETKTQFSDLSGEEWISVNRQVIVPSFNASSQVGEKIILSNSISLLDVGVGNILVDGLNREFEILEVSDDLDNKYIIIETQGSIELVNCNIISAIDRRVFLRKTIPTMENIMIGVHADNTLLTKYFYYILKYILYTGKQKLFKYSMDFAKFNGSDFSLSDSYMPEGIYSRFVTLQFVSFHSWKESEQLIIERVGTDLVLSKYFTIISYDSNTGIVRVSDNCDLSEVSSGDIFSDYFQNNYEIKGNIINTLGNKSFEVAKGQNISNVGNVGSVAKITRSYKVRVPKEAGERPNGDEMTWEDEN